jgi:hypothetical protein
VLTWAVGINAAATVAILGIPLSIESIFLPFPTLGRPVCRAFIQYKGYLSSQTSSMRQPLEMLLTIMVRPLT